MPDYEDDDSELLAEGDLFTEEEIEPLLQTAYLRGREAGRREGHATLKALSECNGETDAVLAFLRKSHGWDEAKHKRNHGKFALTEGSNGEGGSDGSSNRATGRDGAAVGGGAELGDGGVRGGDVQQSGTGEETGKAEVKAQTLASRIAEVPAAVANRVREWVQAKYAKLSARYGETGAKAILGAMVLLAPTPIPGSSLIPVAIAEAVLRLKHAVSGKQKAMRDPLTDDHVRALAGDLLHELYESEGETFEKAQHRFANTHVDLPPEIGERLTALAAMIPDRDLGEDGREDEPHVTARFGLEVDDPEEVARVVNGFGPVRLRLGKVTIFAGSESGKPYDVLKVDVDSLDLHELNRLLAELPHTDTHPTYHPHATIAYVKAGLGEKYAEKMGSVEATAVVTELVFSDRDRNQTRVPLSSPIMKAPADSDPLAARELLAAAVQHAADCLRAGEDAQPGLDALAELEGAELEGVAGGKVEKAWREGDHPRDDDGRFTSSKDIRDAGRDPKKAAELRAKVTDPTERKKLDALLDSKPQPLGGVERSNATRFEPGAPDYHDQEGHEHVALARGDLIAAAKRAADHADKEQAEEEVAKAGDRAQHNNRVHWREAKAKAIAQFKADHPPGSDNPFGNEEDALAKAFDAAEAATGEAYKKMADAASWIAYLATDDADVLADSKHDRRKEFDEAYQTAKEEYTKQTEAVWKVVKTIRDELGGDAKGWKLGRYFKAWRADEHPRSDDGRFVDAHDLHAAQTDPAKAAELRAKVTDPTERAKLDDAIGEEPEPEEADDSEPEALADDAPAADSTPPAAPAGLFDGRYAEFTGAREAEYTDDAHDSGIVDELIAIGDALNEARDDPSPENLAHIAAACREALTIPARTWLDPECETAGEYAKVKELLSELHALTGGTIAKAVAWNEELHPRGRNGRFIGRDRIQEAKSNPKLANQLRNEVKPEDAGKLEDALSGKTDVGRTARGQAKHEAGERRQAKQASRAEALAIRNRLFAAHQRGEPADPEDCRALVPHLSTMTQSELSDVRVFLGGAGASFGGKKLRQERVDRLTEWAKAQAVEGTMEKEGFTEEEKKYQREVMAAAKEKEQPKEEENPRGDKPIVDTERVASARERLVRAHAAREALEKEAKAKGVEPYNYEPYQRAYDEYQSADAEYHASVGKTRQKYDTQHAPGSSVSAESFPAQLKEFEFRHLGREIYGNRKKRGASADEAMQEFTRTATALGHEVPSEDASPPPPAHREPRTGRAYSGADDAAPTEEEFAAASGQTASSKPAASPQAASAPAAGEGAKGKGKLKGVTSSNPATMTASQINRELDALSQHNSEFADTMINAGRGHETWNDYKDKGDDISEHGKRIARRVSELHVEIALRYGPAAPHRLPEKGFPPREKKEKKPAE